MPRIRAVATGVKNIGREGTGIGGSAVACGLAVVCGVSLGLLQPSTSVALIAGIALTTCIPLLIRALNIDFDPFEPIVVFAIVWAVMFVVRPIAMLAENEFTYVYAPTIDFRNAFNGMLALSLVGGLSFVVGYSSGFGRTLAARLPRPVEDYDPSRVALVCAVVAGVSLFLYAGYVAQVGGLSAALSRSATVNVARQQSSAYFYIAPVMLIGSTLTVYALRSRLKAVNSFLLTGGLLVAALVIFISYGARSSLLFLVGGGVIYWYVSRERRPRPLTFFVGLIIALLVSAILGASRDEESRKQNGGTVAIATGIVRHPTTAFRPLTSEGDAAEAPSLAAAMTIIPQEIPHTYGASFLGDLLARPIPRQLWPGKPLPPTGEVAATLSPAEYKAGLANPEFSCLLVPFLDFGYFGGLILILYGVIARTAYEWFRRYRTIPMAQLIFALSVPLTVFALRDNAVNIIYRGLPLLAPVVIAFTFGRVRE